MFRVISMMNSAGPGATGVKKERERKGGGAVCVWERETVTDRKRERVREKKNCACFLIMTESHYKVVPFLNKEIWFMYINLQWIS